jgi:hypothetical protein
VRISDTEFRPNRAINVEIVDTNLLMPGSEVQLSRGLVSWPLVKISMEINRTVFLANQMKNIENKGKILFSPLQ